MAQVTMSTEEYGALLRAREDALNEVVKLQNELTEAKKNAAPTAIRNIVALARHQLAVVRFAVAQMPPEAHKGWPVKDLEATCDLMSSLPDYSIADQEIVMAFRAFMVEVLNVERIRGGMKTDATA